MCDVTHCAESSIKIPTKTVTYLNLIASKILSYLFHKFYFSSQSCLIISSCFARLLAFGQSCVTSVQLTELC